MCVILQLVKPLQSQYWVNVCDEDLPFGGIIEHTNLVPSEHYGGRHVVYLSRYFTEDEDIATVDLQSEAARWLDLLVERFPTLDRADVLGLDVFRTPYAAPLVQLGYNARVTPLQSHIAGLWVGTTAQIYPQDRGMSQGVQMGSQIAASFAAAKQPGAPNVS
jgi:protoporphyrinogen oxidase